MKKPKEYLRAPYARILVPDEDGSFSAEILEFTGCFAQGETAEEALQNLEKAAAEWLEAALKQGREIPEPSATRGFSGTISLRLPKGLHRQAARMAERDGVSLNQYLLTAIAARVGADDLFNRLSHLFSRPKKKDLGRSASPAMPSLLLRPKRLVTIDEGNKELGHNS